MHGAGDIVAPSPCSLFNNLTRHARQVLPTGGQARANPHWCRCCVVMACRWSLSPSRATPNQGFTPDGVLPTEAESGGSEAQPDPLGGGLPLPHQCCFSVDRHACGLQQTEHDNSGNSLPSRR